MRCEQLQRDGTVELFVLGEPHLGHAAVAELLDESISAADDLTSHAATLFPVTALLSLDEAIALVLERARPLAAEDVPVRNGAGRVLAEDVTAVVDLPPFPSSAMDGFAVRAADTPGMLPVVARIAAGLPADQRLGAGEAMAIATGGVVPEGADTVVPIEDVVEHDNEVEIPTAAREGANVRPRGGDVAAGDVVVPAGTRLGPAQLGALAASGVAGMRCGRRPRVAVLTTGTELRRPGEALGPGEVYEANGLVLRAALAAAGGDIHELAPVEDDEEAHRAAIATGLEADVLVTSGGVSVGPHDLVRRIEHDLGVEEVFWGVAVKPGKPVSFGVRGRTMVFGLPGNPVSALVGCELFVRPAVLALQGASDPGPTYELGRLATPIRRNASRDELVRARAAARDGIVELDAITGQESHMIARAATANALVLVPRGDGDLPAGETARYLRLSPA
jgi:molybdopterin molybdotransferase